MCQLLFTVGLLMTCLRWTSAAAVPGPVYVAVDGTAVLHPGSDHTGDIKTVTWKYGADKAAELDGSVTICYQQFKGRCELNIITGELTIKQLTLSDSGFYSVEINGKEVNTVQLWVMYRVPKPSVFTWCDVKKTYCLLTCEGTSSVPESLQYRWNEENDWSHSVKVLNISKENKEPEFSCELKNTVSSSRSDPVQNPFITAPVPKPSVSTWCDPTKTYCLLTCEGTTSEPELLQYRWKEENDWSHSMKVLKITKENKEPEFSCELKNPVSSSRSDPVQNPFITVGTVYMKIDGTAVLHPGSAHTGNIKTVTWKHGADKAAEWSGRVSVCYRQFEDRCELNTRTGELTIKHLKLSDSGSYSVEVNNKETNRVQLQVKKGTVCEVDGTAVLHPGSALTGNITKIIWKYNGSEAASWAEKMPHYYGQFEVRCALNTRTGELTINHLKLSDSGSYSVEINNKETNRVQLQVMNKSSV
ncbi:uncharacterized protein V6R79_019645 [Siganus canaliculatus]